MSISFISASRAKELLPEAKWGSALNLPMSRNTSVTWGSYHLVTLNKGSVCLEEVSTKEAIKRPLLTGRAKETARRIEEILSNKELKLSGADMTECHAKIEAIKNRVKQHALSHAPIRWFSLDRLYGWLATRRMDRLLNGLLKKVDEKKKILDEQLVDTCKKLTPSDGVKDIIDQVVLCDNVEAFSVLLEEKKDLFSIEQQSLLVHMAARHGSCGVMQKLLSLQEIKIETQDENGETPLHIAAQHGHLELVQQLVECAYKRGTGNLFYSRSFLNSQNSDGDTALHLAAWEGHLDIVQFLLKQKQTLLLPNKKGDTPIFDALQKGHAEVARVLLDNSGINRTSGYFSL